MTKNYEMVEFLAEMARNETAFWDTYMPIYEEWKRIF